MSTNTSSTSTRRITSFSKDTASWSQVQSSWFPLIDRNPQTYVPNIFQAKDSRLQSADASHLPHSDAATYVQVSVVNARCGNDALLIAALAALPLSAAGAQKSIAPDWAAFDRYVAQAAHDWQVPALAIAVVKDDSLVFAKGYGVLEIGKNQPRR